MSSALELDRVVCRYGDGPVVVHAITLALAAREFLCLLGPSGCGKTTLLRAIGGYLPVAGGVIRVGGRDVTALGPERRQIGMVFQNYALFPHLSARRNVAFGLAVRGMGRAAQAVRVERELRRVDLAAELWDRKPAALSGGQQQRVALARALAPEPSLLLLDEPLANLDRGLRDALRGELKRVQHEAGVACVLVTHDQEEALTLADRVALMRAGRLVQVGSPGELYERPRTPFAARFVGDANLLLIRGVEAGGWVVGSGVGPGVVVAGEASAAQVGRWLLLRPEQLVVGAGARGCRSRWVGVVEAVVYLGADCRVTVRVGEERLLARVRAGELAGGGVEVGAQVEVGVRVGEPWVVPDDDIDEVGDGI